MKDDLEYLQNGLTVMLDHAKSEHRWHANAPDFERCDHWNCIAARTVRMLLMPQPDLTHETGYLVHWLEPRRPGMQVGSMHQACRERRPGPNPLTTEIERVTCRACLRIHELVSPARDADLAEWLERAHKELDQRGNCCPGIDEPCPACEGLKVLKGVD